MCVIFDEMVPNYVSDIDFCIQIEKRNLELQLLWLVHYEEWFPLNNF